MKKNNRCKTNWRKICMSLIVLLVAVFLVYAIKISNFDNNLNKIDIFFRGDGNYTYNLTFYVNANITSATLNLSGYIASGLCYQETANYSINCDSNNGVYGWTAGWDNPANLYDGDFSTYSSAQAGTNYFYINYTIPPLINGSFFKFKTAGIVDSNFTIPILCLNESEPLQVRISQIVPSGFGFTQISVSCFGGNNWNSIGGTSEEINGFYEEGIYWNSSNSITRTIPDAYNWSMPYTFRPFDSGSATIRSRNITAAFDGNWSTGAQIQNTNVSGIFYINYTNTFPGKAIHTIEYDSVSLGSTDGIHLQCYNDTEWLEYAFAKNNGWSIDSYEINYSSCLYKNTTMLKIQINSSDYSIIFWESNLTFDSFVYNPSLKLNNSNLWFVSKNFSQINTKLSDFSSSLRNATNNGLCDCVGCSLNGNNCTINLTFHSDTQGILKISDININWHEDIKPNLTIEHPNQTYNGLTYIPVNFTAIDDYQLSYCFYNITRGASLEIANTQIINCQNTTFTVSGDASYVFWMCINDTSGNENCSSTSFKTINYVPPPVISVGPSGGGYVPEKPEEEKEKVSVCEKTIEPLKESWENFKKEINFENFKKLWFAYWNYSLCHSAASIIPL